jgi:hypothetical protein
MTTFNEVDIHLLNRWDDISKLKDALSSLEDKMQNSVGEIVSELEYRDWWNRRQFTEPYSNKKKQIAIWKKTWIVGDNKKWDHVSLWVEDIDLDNLFGSARRPTASVWTEKLGTNKDNFEKLFEQHAKNDINEIRKSAGIKVYKDSTNAFRYYLTETPGDWIEILKAGRFTETILENFDILAKFIDPIDKALAEIRTTKKK